MQEALAGLKDGSNAEFGEAEWRTTAELKRAKLSSLASRKDR